eukprot:TRINITY_DN1755_c0_g2_i1.p1 TRINITY_DN1755_c0_g2~~TRINITY_DN1755_c0_g2_i1.p1  ORF type:complete len:617 (+),score=144.97 TRINITY_DN1755_c0_g2_i1:850-2700(+)
MPPKKKGKRSKKQSRAEKRAEAERLAEEQRQKELAELEELERERELERQRQYEEEARRRREEEKARLDIEEVDLNGFLNERALQLDRENEAFKAEEEWDRYLECSPLPDPATEHELTTWLSLWKDKREWDTAECLDLCEKTACVVDDIMRHYSKAQVQFDKGSMEHFLQYRKDYREMIIEKMDQMTAFVLQHADEYATAKNEVQIATKTDHFKYGLWVNLARNPRVKQVEFADLEMSCDLTKALAIASIGIRLTLFDYDRCSEDNPGKFVPLGGVFTYDLLTLPPASKKVKSWTLRQVTHLAERTQPLPYPLQSASGEPSGVPANITPIRCSYVLPGNVLLREDTPTVGWFDEEAGQWKTDGITETRYDEVTREVSFQTIHLAPMAVLQNRYPDLRFERWELQPTGVNKAVFTLHLTGRDVAIEIGAGYARLLTPKDKELNELHTSRMPVADMLRRLAKCGMYILPSDDDVTFLNGSNVKDPELLQTLFKDMSYFVPSYAFVWSRWNREGGLSSSSCVFRVKEFLKWDAPLKLDEDEVWRTVMYNSNNDVMFINATESLDAFDNSIAEGEKSHLSLYNTLQPSQSPEAVQRVNEASARFTESVREILDLLRVLDFC